MTDAQKLTAFVQCEQRWLGVLTELRNLHGTGLGKRMTAVQWLPDGSRGSYGWLGYYWESPPFWFGYGLRHEAWLPLIECDIRRCDPAFVTQLEAHLPSTWSDVDRLGGAFWRLWAPDQGEGRAPAQLKWLSDRSRELHEFTVTA